MAIIKIAKVKEMPENKKKKVTKAAVPKVTPMPQVPGTGRCEEEAGRGRHQGNGRSDTDASGQEEAAGRAPEEPVKARP
jgi:hypothetical protein